MLGQPPRFALTTPVFRFRSLTAASGRAALGGDRETLLACLQLARLCAGILPPNPLSRDITIERTENTKQWLAGLAVPAGIRSVGFGIFGALNGFDRARCAIAFADLVKAAAAQLDEASKLELNELMHELAASSTAGHERHTVQQFHTS